MHARVTPLLNKSRLQTVDVSVIDSNVRGIGRIGAQSRMYHH
jgi:hypothetical protein